MNALRTFVVAGITCATVAFSISASAAGDPVEGKTLYQGHCLGCHRPAGDNAIAKAPTADVIANLIATDPPMKIADLQLLTSTQLADIAAYLATILPPSTSASLNFQGLWWNAPAASEDGWGINFAHQGDTVFASWFTYDASGKGWWLVMTAAKTATNTFSGTLYQTHGPAFNAVPFAPKFTATPVGTGTLAFADAGNGTFAYTVNGISQTKSITRQVFGPLPTCSYGTQPNLALATNYQDLWWNAPAASEDGWGINFTHQGDTLFATWFTYDLDGSPLWLVATAPKSGPGTYTGTLYRTTGPAFSAVPFAPKFVPTAVGTATFTFADGNHASFAYSITGIGPTTVSQTKQITRQLFTSSGTTCQ
jgi:hypothetical protein